MSVWAIVVAGGSGQRFGRPKQFDVLSGRRVVDWSLAAAMASSDGVVLVVPAGRENEVEAGFGCLDRVPVVVSGGATRSASVRAGLAAVPAAAEVVVVHDAARPLATPALFAAVVAAVRAGADAAVPGVAVTDSIRHVDGGAVDRGTLVAVQTPQAFDAATLRRAHRGEPEASDDASVVEAIGGKVVVVPGETTNLKITSPHDLLVAEALLSGGHDATEAAP